MAILGTKKRSRIGSLILIRMAACALFLAGCRAVIPTPGSLTVEGATRSADDAAKGFLTTVDCSPLVAGSHATKVNDKSFASIPLLNAGSAEVVITGVELILLDGNGAPSTHAQSYFTWAGQAPDVPLTLAVGKKAIFNVAFSSSTAGVFSGCLNIYTSDGCQQVRLTGEAGWPITLTVTNGTNNYGQITAPVTVTKGQSVEYLCAGSTLTLTAESTDPVQLTELKAWSCTGDASIPGTANANLTITATITGAASINAKFRPDVRAAARGRRPFYRRELIPYGRIQEGDRPAGRNVFADEGCCASQMPRARRVPHRLGTAAHIHEHPYQHSGS